MFVGLITTQSSNISFDCLLTTLDGSTNNTFGNLYVYFKESATSSPIMVNYFQSVTFLPPTGNQTDYTSSLLNQSFLLNKSDFYNTGGLFYIEYKNNNNETFRSQNYNVTGGSKTIIVPPPPGSADFNIQEIKYSDNFPLVNNKVILPNSGRYINESVRSIDIIITPNANLINKTVNISISGMKEGNHKSITNKYNITLTNNTKITLELNCSPGFYVTPNSGYNWDIVGSTLSLNITNSSNNININKELPITFERTNTISNNVINDYKFISSGQNISFLNQNIASLSTGIRPQTIITQIQTYKWQYKIENTNTWIDFSNQTSANLTNSGAITQNMLVRRVAFHNNGNYSISNNISVSVDSPILANTICCNQTMVNGNIPQNFIGNQITGNNYSYCWERKQIQGLISSNNNYWIGNYNNKDYNFSLAIQNRGSQDVFLYRRLIKQNEIVISVSNEVSLTINNASRIGIYNNSTEIIKENNNINNSTIVSPNPTKDILNIELPNSNYKNLVIVNILGEIVKENTINNQKNLIIDMSNYKSGIYFLILEDNLGSIQSRKIIKE